MICSPLFVKQYFLRQQRPRNNSHFWTKISLTMYHPAGRASSCPFEWGGQKEAFSNPPYSLLLTNPGFKTVSSNMPRMPNKGIIMQSLFRVRQTSNYEVLFLNIEFHILFIAQFFSLMACWACTRHYVSTKHSDHYTFLGNCPPTLP